MIRVKKKTAVQKQLQRLQGNISTKGEVSSTIKSIPKTLSTFQKRLQLLQTILDGANESVRNEMIKELKTFVKKL